MTRLYVISFFAIFAAVVVYMYTKKEFDSGKVLFYAITMHIIRHTLILL